MYLIELTIEEHYLVNSQLFPVLTHCRLVNLQWEVGRNSELKPAQIEVWIAKGYVKDGVFYEAPGYSGVNIVFDSDEAELVNGALTQGESLSAEACRMILELCVQTGRLAGTIVSL